MDILTGRTLDRFKKATLALEKAVALGDLPEHADRDAVLLRFELAAELMPKVLRRILSERGSSASLPKDIVRDAFSAKMFAEKDATTLLAAIDDRNRMVHDYSEEYALKLLQRIKTEYVTTFRTLTTQIS